MGHITAAEADREARYIRTERAVLVCVASTRVFVCPGILVKSRAVKTTLRCVVDEWTALMALLTEPTMELIKS